MRFKSLSSASVTKSSRDIWSGSLSPERMPQRMTAASRWRSSAFVKPTKTTLDRSSGQDWCQKCCYSAQILCWGYHRCLCESHASYCLSAKCASACLQLNPVASWRLVMHIHLGQQGENEMYAGCMRDFYQCYTHASNALVLPRWFFSDGTDRRASLMLYAFCCVCVKCNK